ncbi:ROK family protein [Belliella kenyensis]|uniref:ROK family protein n=1 Tax=Belliella kenyensis TaxID=1472724 RepID=A0ABV8EN84_9BACT|nr:ROK family protein [Belliella kenyensis]MCH7400585.1 ROK family protein [Belliella kenyensis]MDN3602128.1 ROK family protein [Belliella kenyensis]
MQNLWGIDLGGTKIEGVIVNTSSGIEELLRLRVPTEAHLGYEHILSQVKKLVEMMIQQSGETPKMVGIASPGTYIPTKKIMKNCNATVINGRDLKTDLEGILGFPIALANDANCFALAEARLGVGKMQYPEAKVIFGVILGTGVGGGLVVNGQIINGKHGIGGEWGHNYLYPGEGNLCYCGKQGCNEQIISGPALERYYESLTVVKRPLKEIYERSKDGDAAAKQTMTRLIEGFQKAFSIVINVVDPDLIVLGGGVSHIDLLYNDHSLLKEMVFNHEFETPLVKAALGDSAGVFGAALLLEGCEREFCL